MLDLCTTGSESGKGTGLVLNRFGEWLERRACVQPVHGLNPTMVVVDVKKDIESLIILCW